MARAQRFIWKFDDLDIGKKADDVDAESSGRQSAPPSKQVDAETKSNGQESP